MVFSGGMEPKEKRREEKKLSDDLVAFVKKRNETEAPRYTTSLKSYVKLQNK